MPIFTVIGIALKSPGRLGSGLLPTENDEGLLMMRAVMSFAVVTQVQDHGVIEPHAVSFWNRFEPRRQTGYLLRMKCKDGVRGLSGNKSIIGRRIVADVVDAGGFESKGLLLHAEPIQADGHHVTQSRNQCRSGQFEEGLHSFAEIP